MNALKIRGRFTDQVAMYKFITARGTSARSIVTVADEKKYTENEYNSLWHTLFPLDARDEILKKAAILMKRIRKATDACDPEVLLRSTKVRERWPAQSRSNRIYGVDYTNDYPLSEVRRILERCRESILFFNRQIEPFIKRGFVSPKADTVMNAQLRLFLVNEALLGIKKYNYKRQMGRGFPTSYTAADEKALYTGTLIPPPSSS